MLDSYGCIEYIKTDGGLYAITLSFQDRPDHEIMVSINTRTTDFKKIIRWCGLVQDIPENIVLTLDEEVIDRMFMCVPSGAIVGVVCHPPLTRQTITVKRITDSNSFTFGVDRTSSVADLKRFLSTATGIPVDRQRLVLRGEHLGMDRTVQSLVLLPSDVIYLVPSLQGDIGIFQTAHLVVPIVPDHVYHRILEIRESTPGYDNHPGMAVFHTGADGSEPVLYAATMTGLIQHFEDHQAPTLTVDQDQQVTMSVAELRSLLDPEEFRCLYERFGGRVDEIVLRRTYSDIQKGIPFHLDCATRTLQVPLNQIDTDYTGGRTIVLLIE
jgi:hypothetical protein